MRLVIVYHRVEKLKTKYKNLRRRGLIHSFIWFDRSMAPFFVDLDLARHGLFGQCICWTFDIIWLLVAASVCTVQCLRHQFIFIKKIWELICGKSFVDNLRVRMNLVLPLFVFFSFSSLNSTILQHIHTHFFLIIRSILLLCIGSFHLILFYYRFSLFVALWYHCCLCVQFYLLRRFSGLFGTLAGFFSVFFYCSLLNWRSFLKQTLYFAWKKYAFIAMFTYFE